MAALNRPVVKPRPVYLNLFAIRLPLPAFVSILHRASGALLFAVGIPLLLLLAQRALASPEGWAHMQSLFARPWVKLGAVILVWAALHHLLAGLRHVLMDMHYGMELKAARQSAAFVFVLALLLTLVVAVRLW
jgi:succinate dehydrogenase / fumarate reductase cytochrome b subunit